MSKSLTVRSTSRSSMARSAPISYTAPVSPPPARTRAVLPHSFPIRALFICIVRLPAQLRLFDHVVHQIGRRQHANWALFPLLLLYDHHAVNMAVQEQVCDVLEMIPGR